MEGNKENLSNPTNPIIATYTIKRFIVKLVEIVMVWNDLINSTVAKKIYLGISYKIFIGSKLKS